MTSCKFQFVMRQCMPLPFVARTHTHDCYEVVYYITGTGLSVIDGVQHPYSDGTYCIIPPNTGHSEIAQTQTDLIYVGFDFHYPSEFLTAGLLYDQDGSILSIMERVKEEMCGCGAFFDDMLEVETRRLVLYLLRLTATDNEQEVLIKKRETTTKLLDYTVHFMETNCLKEIDLELLANSIGYSYHRFRHLFQQAYLMTPRQFIQHTRIQKAKYLLRTSGERVESLAKLCGFNSCPQFITAFKNATGLTPLRYRKKSEEIAHF